MSARIVYFNGHFVPEEEAKVDVKLHLSNASQALMQELKNRVGDFLEKNRDIASELKKMTLNEENQGVGEDLSVRKLGAYLRHTREHCPRFCGWKC